MPQYSSSCHLAPARNAKRLQSIKTVGGGETEKLNKKETFSVLFLKKKEKPASDQISLPNYLQIPTPLSAKETDKVYIVHPAE